MIFSLIAGIVSVLRPKRNAESGKRKAGSGKRIIPSVEVLEERSLPSATIMPTPGEIPFLITVSDVLAATAPKGNPTVVFLGDSINYQYAYGTGAPVWAAFMAPLGMTNYGISGQTTQNLLFELAEGQLVGINPAAVVLDIGGNNLLQGDSPLATAAGILTDVAAVHQYLPQTQVFVLGILPGKEYPTDPYRTEGAQTNQLVSRFLDGDPHTTFLDLGGIFLQPNGTISSSMMFDYIHPTEQGYLDLTAVLLPILEQTLISTSTTVPMLMNFPNVPLTPVNVPQLYPASSPLSLSPS